jgi:hypothetical protein
MADYTRSVGAANLMNSQAASNWEDTRTKNIQNRVYSTEAYFDMRRINREARAAESGPRPTQEDMARYARARMPGTLSVSELDPVSGQIHWPMVLQEQAYQGDRETLDRAAAALARQGHLNAEQRNEVRRLVQSMQSDLKQNIDQHSPMDYINAKKFLEKMEAGLYASTG